MVVGREGKILENSKIINQLLTFSGIMYVYSETSIIVNLIRLMKNKIFSAQAKLISIILIAISLSSLFFSGRELAIFSLITHALFLFAGLIWLFCKVDYRTLKGGSIILRYLNKEFVK